MWHGVAASRDGLVLHANYQDSNGRLLSAPFDPARDKVGDCKSTTGSEEFDCPWFHAWGGPEVLDARQCVLGRIKLPEYDPFVLDPEKKVQYQLRPHAVLMRGKRDGWLVAEVGAKEAQHVEVHRYDGVSWGRVATLAAPSAYASMWADDAGHAWLLTTPPALARFDGRAMTKVAIADRTRRLTASPPAPAYAPARPSSPPRSTARPPAPPSSATP